jgi:hypothetical protein
LKSKIDNLIDYISWIIEVDIMFDRNIENREVLQMSTMTRKETKANRYNALVSEINN